MAEREVLALNETTPQILAPQAGDTYSMPRAVRVTGTATADSFIPTSSTVPTNGMFLGAANAVSIATNSTERWMVNASGNLNPVGSYGIGTTLAPVNGVVTTSLTLQSNISAPAWTTSGIKLKGGASTLTDTTSSGTVAAAYTNVLGGNTVAASNSTTFTDYISTYISDPVVGTNVTITNKWSLGTQGAIKAGGAVNAPAYQLSSSGVITESGTTRTLSATDNGKVIYCTSGSAVTITTATGLGAGFSAQVVQNGAGQVTIAAGASTTLNGYGGLVKTAGQYAVILVFAPVADTFIVAGQTA